MNSHFKKNIPVQFLTFVVDADNMIMIMPINKHPNIIAKILREQGRSQMSVANDVPAEADLAA